MKDLVSTKNDIFSYLHGLIYTLQIQFLTDSVSWYDCNDFIIKRVLSCLLLAPAFALHKLEYFQDLQVQV